MSVEINSDINRFNVKESCLRQSRKEGMEALPASHIVPKWGSSARLHTASHTCSVADTKAKQRIKHPEPNLKFVNRLNKKFSTFGCCSTLSFPGEVMVVLF